MSLLLLLIDWFVLAMFVWLVLSYIVNFVRVGWDHPVRRIYDGLSTLVAPVLRPISPVVPPLRSGGASHELAPPLLSTVRQLLRLLLGGGWGAGGAGAGIDQSSENGWSGLEEGGSRSKAGRDGFNTVDLDTLPLNQEVPDAEL